MSISILFIISIPIFAKLFRKYRTIPVISMVIVIPRIIGWKYINSSYIAFLFPLFLGMIFTKNNMVVSIANWKINKNPYINKILKFCLESFIIVLLYKLYNQLPSEKFWEIRYGIIPTCLICYLYEFYLDLPISKQILCFLGKYAMDIFLIHEFIRTDYLTRYIYSYRNFAKIAIVLLIISLIISILIELFKKIIRYDKIINKLQNTMNKMIDKLYSNGKTGDV